MVSTRQCTTKFSVGETVLCYEPDESKAKVLYESKILEIDFTKDEKGKKVPEYFVHFSGWNKSWDRWVLEDQIVAGTEVNRQRMKRLHEEAVNRLKNRKKRKSITPNVDTPNTNVESGLDDAPSTQSVPTPSSPSAPSIDIEIPCALKLKLEDDCYFIKRKKKLVRLPRSPNVIDILKEYINHVTLQESHQQPSNDVQSSVKIVKEVMDGLRVYFDFTLPSLLLYNIERDQHEKAMKEAAMKRQKTNDVKTNYPSDVNTTLEKSSIKIENIVEEGNEKNETKPSIKSKRTTEKCADEPSKDDESNGRVLRRRSKRQSVSSTSSSASSNTPGKIPGTPKAPQGVSSDTKTTTKKGVKRKLPASTIAKEEDAVVDLNTAETSIPPVISPSQVYGVEHLLRLFVRLPSLLAKTKIEDSRLPFLLHHLTDFLSYLSTRVNTLTSEDAYGDIAVL
ncbi:protein MRG2-like [Dendronephthya gigantea]|uniref:protein MRG2-like n=1 Tax=Dendronephthya gigantea TaxID=151771 RepID=UPI001069C5FF|nr:protein MRG2-like [Dendronephthya gigantea]